MKYLYLKHLVLPTVLLITLSTPVIAEESTLETVVVTATRTEQKLADTLSPVTVITAEDIDRLQSKDIYELLNRIPGLTFARSGGSGSTTDMFLRGTNSSQTLILVDGIRINSATLGTTSIQHLDPAQIERIEVVRGTHSSLYGSDAVGGVISITTKKGKPGMNASLTTGAGSFSARENAINVSAGNTSSRFNLGLKHYEEDGFDRTEDTTRTSGDEDAYKNTSIAASGGYDFSEKLSGDIHYSRNKGESEYDSNCFDAIFTQVNCTPYDIFDIESLSAKLNAMVSDLWKVSLVAGHSSDLSQIRDELVTPALVAGSRNEFQTSRDSFLFQNDFSIEQQTITLGFDYYDDQVDADFDNGAQIQETSRFNKAIFAQYQTKISNQTIILGARNDDNEQFGSEDTWRVSWGMPLTDRANISVAYATGFNAPSFNALYWPLSTNFFDYIGNPDLSPEESKNLDVTLKVQQSWGAWEASVYEYHIDDLIVNGPIPADPFFRWSAFNVKQAEIEGFELLASTDVAGWIITPTYSYVNARDEATDNYLPRRTQHTLQADVDRNFGRFDVGFSWLTHSHRYNDVTNTTRLSGYGVLDARLAYTPIEDLELSLKLNNLFDQNYVEATGFNGDFQTAGFNAFVSATYSF